MYYICNYKVRASSSVVHFNLRLVFYSLVRYDEVLYQCNQELQPRYLVNFLMTLW